MRSSATFNLAAPAATVVLLAAMALGDQLRIDPHAADSFHVKAAASIANVSRQLGRWVCTAEHPLSKEVDDLLRPNGYLDRVYTEMGGSQRVALILIVQCRDSRTMLGHYPPICYPAQGCQIPRAEHQQWMAGSMHIDGTEYELVYPTQERRVVRNFFVLPAGRILADMEEVGRAAKDYQELTFGVTQVQVMFLGTASRSDRDEMFSALIGANTELISTLRSKQPAQAPAGVKS